ncbi:probable serine/threonine-protein kinase cdc7 [Clytia hemisphaerica]|uniref:Cnidarian restricted protein n=1 Tax=Clytia hemisphaerica TaxID=252671 RepID=A0A7M5WKY5_9CNID
MHLKIVLVVFLATSLRLVASAPRKNHHKTKTTKQHEQLTETEDNQAIANDEGEEVSSTADDDENSADGGSTSLERIGFQQEVVPVQQTQQQVVQTQQTPTVAQQQNQQNLQEYNNNGTTSSNMLNQLQQQQQQPLSSNPSVAATPILNQQNSLATNFGKTFKNVSSDSTKKLHMLTEKDEELKCFNDFGSKMNTTNGKTADKLVEIYEGLHKCLTNRKCNYKKAEVLLKNCITPQNPYQNYTCYYTWYEQIKKDCDPNRGDERPKAENAIPSRGTSQSKLELKDNIVTPNDKAS